MRKLEPSFHERIWGVTDLAPWFPYAPVQAAKPVGEVWFETPEVPLLVKFLFTREKLSVQVHPNDLQARFFNPRENGKTEAWVILDAQPGSRIYAGLKRDIDPFRLQRHLKTGTVEECLHSYPARAGDCVACHTAVGETPFAGGRRIATPFGDVYSSNLTPDDATGIGRWSRSDFWRALHYGKSRDGRRLYPAFPYPNLTRVTREDSDAIYAYLRSLAPVSRETPAATVGFPYDTQLALRVWRALYFRAGEAKPDPSRSAQWNRGAYLVEGLGHCSACHAARTCDTVSAALSPKTCGCRRTILSAICRTTAVSSKRPSSAAI